MAQLTFNEAYTLMEYIIRTDPDAKTAIAKKTIAFNEGQKELLLRMSKVGKLPGSQLYIGKDLVTTANTHNVTLPDDYIDYQTIYRKTSDDQYEVFYPKEILPYDMLVKHTGNSFFDSSFIGEASLCALKGDSLIFFDKYFEESDTNKIKIDYWNYAADAVAYDQISIENKSGAFTVGEEITTVAGASAIVYAQDVAGTYVQVTSSSVGSTAFTSGVEITGTDSGETADTTSALSEKAQVLDLTSKYKMLLANAGATMYLFLEGSMEAQEKDAVFDNLITGLPDIHKGHRKIRGSY